MKRTIVLLFATLLACEDSGEKVPGASHPTPFRLAPATSSEDPEDITCGVHCGPGSIRECLGEPGIETCAPSGMGWSACGYDGFERVESKCAKGTRCVARPSGDLSLCEKECAVETGGAGGADGADGAGSGGAPREPEELPVCTKCKRDRVYGGLMGCRAICKVDTGGACEPGEDGTTLELVRCEAATPSRAAAAGCVAGPEPQTYCCPGGSAILNPLFRRPERFRQPAHIVPPQVEKPLWSVPLERYGAFARHLCSFPREDNCAG